MYSDRINYPGYYLYQGTLTFITIFQISLYEPLNMENFYFQSTDNDLYSQNIYSDLLPDIGRWYFVYILKC